MTRTAKTTTEKTTLLSKKLKRQTRRQIILNVIRYINLRFTDSVTYEDNEKNAGSENVNGYNGKDDRRFQTTITNCINYEKRRQRQRRWRVKTMERTMAY